MRNSAEIGLTGARAETIRALAHAVCSGKISFEGVVDSDAFLDRLCEIPGIGKWTAQYVAMRALGEPDAFPSSDLGLLRALGYGVLASWSSAPKPGARGALMQPCISGESRAKIQMCFLMRPRWLSERQVRLGSQSEAIR